MSGQTITITGVTRAAAQTVVVTYGSGATATAPATTGAQTWQIQQSSTAAGVVNLHRRLARRHRLRERRVGDAHRRGSERLGVADREYDLLHVHGGCGWHERRHDHARRSGRLERASISAVAAGYTTSTAGVRSPSQRRRSPCLR